MITTIQIESSLKEKLDRLKVHHRETYNELLSRLIACSSPKNADKESLIETVETISSPEEMESIARGLRDFEEGRFKTLEQIKKELKLNV
jgi:predicted transcriptional regulator